MFYSENLLSKEGPLAQVWLAANLERKLSKNQFIQSNIIQSTQAIVKATNENEESEALALRLSGQLLYGVVRIYSRKAKYLLDDVSDALLKLKSAFKSNSNMITLPVNATIIPSVNQLILQDTITQSDLLYQEPLTFDEEPKTSNYFGNFEMEDTTIDSIEIPRTQVDELDNLQNDDLDIDLNFDIEEDNNNNQAFNRSIEIARADESNLSRNAIDEYDEPLDFDFGTDWEEPILEVAEESSQPVTLHKKVRAPRISTAGQKKIINDKEIEIPIKNFNNTEDILIESEEEFDLNSKRTFIDSILKDNLYIKEDIANNLLTVKRQKVSTTINELNEEEVPELEHSTEEVDFNQENQEDISFNFGWEDEDNHVLPVEQDQHEEEELEDFNSNSTEGISETTMVISNQLKSIFKNKEITIFTEVIEKNSLSDKPLSNMPKSEATRVFFELLVLGTENGVELRQDELFGEIKIKPRENLFQHFV